MSKDLELRLPDHLEGRLEGFRRRIWSVKIQEGIFAAVTGALASFVFVFILDRFFDTPAWARGVLLAAGALGFVVFLPRQVHQWVLGSRRLVDLAKILVSVRPKIGDRLLGILELSGRGSHRGKSAQSSEALVRAAIDQVAEEMKSVDLAHCVPNPRHKKWSAWAAACAVVALAALFVPGAGLNAFQRWIAPWGDTPRYTFVHLQPSVARMVVPTAEPFSFSLTLEEETAWSPAEAVARYGKQDPIEVAQVEGTFHFRLPPQTDAATLKVHVGDAVREVDVVPLARPELATLEAQIELPDYVGHPVRQRDVRGGSVSVLQGSDVSFVATMSRPLREAHLQELGPDGTVASKSSMEIDGDRILVPSREVQDDATLALDWVDVEGLASKQSFPFRVSWMPDEAPALFVQGIPPEKVVLDSETLKFKVEATDDYGLRHVGLEWNGVVDPKKRPDPPRGESIVASGDHERDEILVDGVFCAAHLGIAPQPIELRLFTEDYRPEGERVYSPVYRLYVLDADQHMIWLTERLRDWEQEVLEVRDQEGRLYARNEEIRDLPASALDRPDIRAEMKRQMAEERANGRRLESLVHQGEDWIAQAIRNPQFNTMTLETWAQMLEALKRLGKERMPLVGDLLAEASQAAKASGEPGKNLGRIEAGNDSKPSPAEAGEASDSPEGLNAPSVSNIVAEANPGGSSSKPSSVPSVVDMERGAPSDADNDDSDSGNKGGGGQGRLGMPETVVPSASGGGGGSGDDTPAEVAMDAVTEEQKRLIAEFDAVMGQINDILRNLTQSTFVKRLKHVARRELKMASSLHARLVETFGESTDELRDRERAFLSKWGGRQQEVSEDTRLIQEDLAAYFDRTGEQKFKTVYQQMKDSAVVKSLQHMAAAIPANLSGDGISEAEFWSDECDRWADILVGPG